MKGNFQVRFLEGRVPAMAPGYSTVIPAEASFGVGLGITCGLPVFRYLIGL